MKFNWYKITKSFRGGVNTFQIRVPDVKLKKDDWDEILEWIGEHTDGGHCAGYSIRTRKLPKKHPVLKVVQYPDYLTEVTMGLGKPVTYVREMI